MLSCKLCYSCLPILIFLFFPLLIPAFTSFVPCPLTACVHECLHAPLPTLAFLSLCFLFFSYCLFFFLVPYIFLPDYFIWYFDSINHTFSSEIAEEWGKLGHWRVSILLRGHMVFHSIWTLEFFCFVVLIHVGVPGILAPKLGIKVYYSDSFNIFLSVELLFLKRWTSKGNRVNTFQLLLVEPLGVSPKGFTGGQIPTINLYSNLDIGVAKYSKNVITLVTIEEAIIIFILTYKLHEFEL